MIRDSKITGSPLPNRTAADQIDGLEVFKPIMRPHVQHLRQVVGQIEGGATVDLVMLVPIGRRDHVLKTDAAFHVVDADTGQRQNLRRNRWRTMTRSTLGCSVCVTGTNT